MSAPGGQLERTIISHIDRTIFDEQRLLALAETGCVVELDLFGNESAFWPLGNIDMPNDAQRLKFVRRLIDAGYRNRILISQDICRLTRLIHYGGHGYGHIFRNVIALMRQRGFGDLDIRAILWQTPRELLTIR